VSKGNAVIRLALTLTKEEAQVLDGQSRVANALYNKLLEKAIALKKEFIETQDLERAKTLYTKRGLRNLVPKLKQEHPFFKVVHSSPLKNAALRLTEAIQAYQKSKKGKRKGKRVGFPSFRAWKRKWFSLFYDEPNKGFKIGTSELTLSLGVDRAGKRNSLIIPMKKTHLLKGKAICSLRLVKEGSLYYAVFTVCRKLPEKKPIRKVIALDPNHKNFAYGVDTTSQAVGIKSPKWLKNYDKQTIMRAEIAGIDVAGKTDFMRVVGKSCHIVDLKISSEGKVRNWYWNVLDMGYHRQAGVYSMLALATQPVDTIIFTHVVGWKDDGVFKFKIFNIPQDLIAQGWDEFTTAVEEIRATTEFTEPKLSWDDAVTLVRPGTIEVEEDEI